MRKNITVRASVVAVCLTILGNVTLTQQAAQAVPVQGVIPQDGLVLHLDGLNPLNTSTSWKDKSGNGDNATMANAAFTSGVGYTYNGSTTTGTLGTPVEAHGADSFAYMVRASFTDAAPGTVNARLLGQDWNHITFEYGGNNAVNWGIYNSSVTTGANHFRSGTGKIPTSTLGTSEHMIGISWVADAPSSNTGTARLYLDGVFTKEVLSALKPDNVTATHLSRITSIGSTSWTGVLTEVAIYENFSGAADQLMMDVFTGLDVPPVPEPSSLMLLGLGMVALKRRRRRVNG